MHKVLRKYERWLDNGDKVIVEILKVGNPKYKDGIIYTFRCMGKDGEVVFAIENSHGQPHIHRREKKESVDYGWKTAYLKFEEMVDERERKIKEGKIW
ncbi:MAG: hypothetical protein NTX79_05105 [Candidatus Micrarchaeota archaeon]|nr:hypothetical protein [Candidatus Micrarchaeota archaeon]